MSYALGVIVDCAYPGGVIRCVAKDRAAAHARQASVGSPAGRAQTGPRHAQPVGPVPDRSASTGTALHAATFAGVSCDRPASAAPIPALRPAHSPSAAHPPCPCAGLGRSASAGKAQPDGRAPISARPLERGRARPGRPRHGLGALRRLELLRHRPGEDRRRLGLQHGADQGRRARSRSRTPRGAFCGLARRPGAPRPVTHDGDRDRRRMRTGRRIQAGLSLAGWRERAQDLYPPHVAHLACLCRLPSAFVVRRHFADEARQQNRTPHTAPSHVALCMVAKQGPLSSAKPHALSATMATMAAGMSTFQQLLA